MQLFNCKTSRIAAPVLVALVLATLELYHWCEISSHKHYCFKIVLYSSYQETHCWCLKNNEHALVSMFNCRGKLLNIRTWFPVAVQYRHAEIWQTPPPCSGVRQESRSSWVCSLCCALYVPSAWVYIFSSLRFSADYHLANFVWTPLFPAACNHTVIILLSSLMCQLKARSHCCPEAVPFSLPNVLQVPLISSFLLSSMPQYQTNNWKVLRPSSLGVITMVSNKHQKCKSTLLRLRHFHALVCYGFLGRGKRVIMYSSFDITGTLVMYSCKYFSLLEIHVPAQAIANRSMLSATADANSHTK